MATAFVTELRLLVRNPQLAVILLALPLVFIVLLSGAFEPLFSLDNAYQATVPGFAVMFAFYGASFAADAFFRERIWGNWPRLLAMPTPPASIFVGKLAAATVVIAVQLVLIVALGVVAFDVGLGSQIAGLAALWVATALAATSLGLLLASVGRTQIEIDQISNLVVLSLGAIGGAIVPVERLPSVLEAVSPYTPHYWALQSFRELTVGGGGIGDIWGWLVSLVAFAVVAVIAGVVAFRWERMVEPVA